MTPYIFAKDLQGKDQIAFYEKAFGGKNEGIMKFKDSPDKLPFEITEEQGEGILHTALHFWNDQTIMLSDSFEPITIGNNISLSIEHDNREDIDKAFAVLKEGGKVEMAPGETFFSEYYTNLIDKYGIIWQIIIPKK